MAPGDGEVRLLIDLGFAAVTVVLLVVASIWREERDRYRENSAWLDKQRKDHEARADRYFAALCELKRRPTKKRPHTHAKTKRRT
jgi:hypothetical protein